MIDFDAIADLDAPYEPWQPKIGDRVRITGAIAECRHEPSIYDWIGDTVRPAPKTGHALELMGAIGTVRPTSPNAVDPATHPYAVEFDDGVSCLMPDGWVTAFGAHFAACELEPMPEAVS